MVSGVYVLCGLAAEERKLQECEGLAILRGVTFAMHHCFVRSIYVQYYVMRREFHCCYFLSFMCNENCHILMSVLFYC